MKQLKEHEQACLCEVRFDSCDRATLGCESLFFGTGTRGFSPTFVLHSNANGVRTRGKGRCQLAIIRPAEVHFARKMYLGWKIQLS